MTEHETIYRVDHGSGEVDCWTDNPDTARSWRRLGWPVRVFGKSMATGKEHSWEVRGLPLDRLIFRRAARKSSASTGVL